MTKVLSFSPLRLCERIAASVGQSTYPETCAAGLRAAAMYTMKMVEDTFREFGVALYNIPENTPGGELSIFGRSVPSFHLIDHVFYHTSEETQDWTPAVGMEAVTRAYLKIIATHDPIRRVT